MPRRSLRNINVRDRVVGLERVRARDLKPHPANWRVHTPAQREALRGVLADVGIADALVAYRNDAGKLVLIDGHLRKAENPEQRWPVIVVDLTEEEAKYVLATMDPLAAMAQTNMDSLMELLAGVTPSSDAVKAMLEALANNESAPMPNFEPGAEDEQGRLDQTRQVECPECGHKFTP